MALASSHRINSLSVIKLSDIIDTGSCIRIFISSRIKTSKPGKIQPTLCFKNFEDPVLCVANTIRNYLEVTQPLREESCQQLFISVSTPHKPVVKQTISNWIRKCLESSGIDTHIFGPHSVRHASTSCALRKGVAIDEIKKAASWSENSKVFAQFYNQPLDNSADYYNNIFS